MFCLLMVVFAVGLLFLFVDGKAYYVLYFVLGYLFNWFGLIVLVLTCLVFIIPVLCFVLGLV